MPPQSHAAAIEQQLLRYRGRAIPARSRCGLSAAFKAEQASSAGPNPERAIQRHHAPHRIPVSAGRASDLPAPVSQSRDAAFPVPGPEFARLVFDDPPDERAGQALAGRIAGQIRALPGRKARVVRHHPQPSPPVLEQIHRRFPGSLRPQFALAELAVEPAPQPAPGGGNPHALRLWPGRRRASRSPANRPPRPGRATRHSATNPACLPRPTPTPAPPGPALCCARTHSSSRFADPA